ncbi:hypothetical protein ACH9L7_14870 [Haloferax sp. S1W]|uniref:hypothetical protein n=1 Tax=Haloferax sp. S1W TaxID=3377110 RepID=UPI0037C82D87
MTTKADSTNSTNSSTTTTVPDWEHLPCVQYGFKDGKGPTRAPKLRTIFEPTPEGTATVSPVYLVTQGQYERQERLDSGYEVKGDTTSIATELQDECEDNDRVLYPVHIESDVYHDEGPRTLIQWFREFVEQYLDVPFNTCTLFFSGNRSIHVHVPRFVSGESDRKQLKSIAERFCDETGAELDCGLYYAKRMFRLPGVEHGKTGLRKVEIEPKWDHSRIFRESNKPSPGLPSSYADLLQQIFASQESLTVGTVQTPLDNPQDLFRVLDSDKTVLELVREGQEIETPLIEQEEYPENTAAAPKWLQYNAKEFSPYALASGNKRSVAVLKVKGSPFARKEVRGGASLVPAYFYGARGCAGAEFTKDREHAPLQLSDRDYEKWDYEEGDHVVIIGGQSRNSRIFPVGSWPAIVVGHALTGEDGSREDALAHLESEGYDIGAEGESGKPSNTPSYQKREPNVAEQSGLVSTHAQSATTPAARLQRQAEKKGIETLSHNERGRVACRLLKWGWEPAWEWFNDQYGSAFKPDVTWEQFKNIVESYSDYGHVEVPPKPHR